VLEKSYPQFVCLQLLMYLVYLHSVVAVPLALEFGDGGRSPSEAVFGRTAVPCQEKEMV